MHSDYHWPSIQRFTIKGATYSITEYLRTFEYKENWLYNVEYLMAQSNECSDFYLYEVPKNFFFGFCCL